MPRCENCGAYVSDDFVRVLSRDGDTVRACPRCPDKVRVDGRVRDARSVRTSSHGVGLEGSSDD